MRRWYDTQASAEKLEKKWNDSGMTDCKSAPEFLLRLEIMHTQIDEDDLAFLAAAASDNPDFCRVMSDLVESSKLFDKALSKLEFYIDYYMAMSKGSAPDPLKFGRVQILDMYESGRLGMWRENVMFRDFIKKCVDKVDCLFKGKLEYVRSFRDWMSARGLDK